MAAIDCCDALAWTRVAAAVIGPLIGVGTWAFTYGLTKRSEQRKELTSKIDKLCEQIDSIHKLSYQYHIANAEDRSVSSELHVLLRIFATDLERLDLLDTMQSSGLVIRLRRAVTLENFETKEFVSRCRNDPLLKRIDKACAEIKTSLHAGIRAPR